MHIGIQVPQFNFAGGPAALAPALASIARFVDQNGFYSLWVMDHFYQMEMVGGPRQNMLESYTALGYLAGITEKVKLGALVTGVIYRYPGVLLKTLTTLDTLSGGRAYLGIGAAWYEREARGLGLPYPPTAERFEMLEETLQIFHQVWGGSDQPVRTKHYDLAEPILMPMPIAQPHPPIMIGGGGEQKTLRLVAQYGDACNFFTRLGMDALQAKLDVLRRHCDDLGRDYDSIEKTVLGPLPGRDAASMLQECEQLAEMGFTHRIVNMIQKIETLDTLGMIARDVLPAVSDL